MSLFAQFGTSKQKETDGIRLEFAPNEDGTIPTFIIARAGGANQNYAKTLTRKTHPWKHLIAIEQLPEAKANQILIDTYAESVILGWENVQDQSNQPIPYTREACIALLKALPQLFVDIQRTAENHAKFSDATTEQEIKNS